MTMNGTHAAATTGGTYRNRHWRRIGGRHRFRARRRFGVDNQRRHVGRNRFPHPDAGAVEKPGSHQPGRQQHLPARNWRSSAKCRASVQLNTSFGSLSSSLTSSQALQASSLLGHQALVTSGTARSRRTEPSPVPSMCRRPPPRWCSTSATSSGAAGAADQSRRAVRRPRRLYVGRQGGQWLAGSRRDLHLECAVRGAPPRAVPPRPHWSTAPWRASAWARDQRD